MHLRIKLAALAMAGGTAALVLAGAPALASTQAAGKAITGPEIAYGAVYGKPATANNPVIPVAWRGLVHAHGVFSTNGPAPTKGQHHTFTTSAGNLAVVVTANPTNSQSINVKACHFAFTTRVAFAVVGSKSTGEFHGTSGRGAVLVYFAGYGPRYKSGPHKGQCNTSQNAPELAKGAVASFQLKAVLTLP
ncbi:MAG: hypothetical protein ACLPKE_24150 [Streptosporangiaceae bacterium]